ncbi:hypothetical protein OROMI_026063 [Orobanche minor]
MTSNKMSKTTKIIYICLRSFWIPTTKKASDFINKKPIYKYLLTGVERITGVSMVILLIVAFTLATPHFLKNVLKLSGPFNRLPGFNAFWFSHHLTALVYILLLVHGNFSFLVDKWYHKQENIILLSYLRFQFYQEKSSTLSCQNQAFRHKSGSPFSITSAPRDDYLSIQIWTVGDWTQEVNKYLQKTTARHVSLAEQCLDNIMFYQIVRGWTRPYGAPSQDYKNYDILLLVGIEIGATSFISILRDLINNTRTFEDQTGKDTFCKAKLERGVDKNSSEASFCHNFKHLDLEELCASSGDESEDKNDQEEEDREDQNHEDDLNEIHDD